MAKVSMVNRQIKREKLSKSLQSVRTLNKYHDLSLTNEERFKARLALAML